MEMFHIESALLCKGLRIGQNENSFISIHRLIEDVMMMIQN